MKDKNNSEFEIDARPSDAIALSLKTETPIFVTPNVVKDGTVVTDMEKEQKEAEEFKDFVKDIKPSDFQKLMSEEPRKDFPNEEDEN